MNVVQNMFRINGQQLNNNNKVMHVDHCEQIWLIDFLIHITSQDLKNKIEENWEVSRIKEIVPGEFLVTTRSLEQIHQSEIVRALQAKMGCSFNSAHEKERNLYVL